jgi:hypothetical protein
LTAIVIVRGLRAKSSPKGVNIVSKPVVSSRGASLFLTAALYRILANADSQHEQEAIAKRATQKLPNLAQTLEELDPDYLDFKWAQPELKAIANCKTMAEANLAEQKANPIVVTRYLSGYRIQFDKADQMLQIVAEKTPRENLSGSPALMVNEARAELAKKLGYRIHGGQIIVS